MTGLGLGLAAAAAIYAAYNTKSSNRAIAFVVLAFFAIVGASQ